MGSLTTAPDAGVAAGPEELKTKSKAKGTLLSFSTRVFVFQLHSFYSSKGGNRMTALGTSWQRPGATGPTSRGPCCCLAPCLLRGLARVPSFSYRDRRQPHPEPEGTQRDRHHARGRPRCPLMADLGGKRGSPNTEILSFSYSSGSRSARGRTSFRVMVPLVCKSLDSFYCPIRIFIRAGKLEITCFLFGVRGA